LERISGVKLPHDLLFEQQINAMNMKNDFGTTKIKVSANFCPTKKCAFSIKTIKYK